MTKAWNISPDMFEQIINKNKTNSNIFIHSALLFLFIVVSFLIYFPVTQGHYLYGEDYSIAWTNEGAKLKELFYFSFMGSFVWNIFPDKKIVFLVSSIIIIGFIYVFLRTMLQIVQKKKGVSLLFGYLIILAIVPLSYLAHIIVRYHDPAIPMHRYLVGLEITLLLLFYWGLKNIFELLQSIFNFSENLKEIILTIVLVILTGVTSFLANQNIEKFFTRLHTNELSARSDIPN